MAIFLIMGCPRSGTSITSALCEKLGLNIGKDSTKPDNFNETGYFSDETFRMVEYFFIDFSKGFPQKKSLDAVDSFHVESLKYNILYKQEINHGRDWGFKNNYSSYIVDFLIDNSPVEVHGIITHRPAEESIKSYAKYKGYGEDWSQKHILSHIDSLKEAEEIIINHGNKVLNVDYHTLVSNSEKITKNLADFLGLPWSKEVSDMVKPSLKHF
jgi:hypothetical protein